MPRKAGAGTVASPHKLAGMGSAADSRPRRADFERNLVRIVEAATAVLSEDPRASMAEIADASGVVRATLYRHFPNRDALLMAIFRHALEQTHEVLTAAEPDRGPAPEALVRVLDALTVVGDRYRVISTATDMVELIDAEALARAEEVFAPVVALIERGQADKSLRADLPARWVVAAAVALVNEGARAVVRGDLEVADVAGTVRRTLLEPLVAPGA